MKKALKANNQVGAASQVEDASPHRLVQMLFESAIESIQLAKAAIERQDILVKIKYINKAFDIIDSLKSCLNMEAGEELAQNLDRLYEYLLHYLLNINGLNHAQRCTHLCDLLGELLSAWNAIPPEQHNITSLPATDQSGEEASDTPQNKDSDASP